MLRPDFLYRDTVRVKPFVRYGTNGEEFGEEYFLWCRFETGSKRVIAGGQGGAGLQEVTANARMFCPAGTRIPESSTVQYEGKEYTVARCDVYKAFAESHVEVLLA